MKINLAVYTAIHGYDWQPGTVYPTSDLVRYKRGIGRLPDPLMEELPFGGVFNDGDTVVFYRYHMAIKSDAKGRDSLYLVLGTLPKAEVGKVDFKYLFALSEFAKPLKPAPAQATYIGSAATGTAPDFSTNFRHSLRGCVSLSEIGTWFSHLPNGTLSMRIMGTYVDPAVNVQYEKPHVEPQMSAASSGRETASPQLKANIPVAFPDYDPRFHPVHPQLPVPPKPTLQSMLLPVVLAFLMGGAAGWYAKVAKDWFVDKVQAIQDSTPKANPTSTPQPPPSHPTPSQQTPSPHSFPLQPSQPSPQPSTEPLFPSQQLIPSVQHPIPQNDGKVDEIVTADESSVLSPHRDPNPGFRGVNKDQRTLTPRKTKEKISDMARVQVVEPSKNVVESSKNSDETTKESQNEKDRNSRR